MSTLKNVNAKKEIENLNLNSKQKRVLKQQLTKKETESIVNLNLQSYKNAANFGGLQSKGGNKENMYIYPAGFTAIMKIGLQGKAFRTKCRKTILKFAANMEFFAANNESAKLLHEIELFKIFYKENYLINDFSPASISKTEDKICATFICNLIKDIDLQTAKKSNPKKVIEKTKSKIAKKVFNREIKKGEGEINAEKTAIEAITLK